MLLILCAALVWHVIHWHATDMYIRLFDLIQEGKAYLPVLYNLGLVTATASILGLLMGKITDLLSSGDSSATTSAASTKETKKS